MVMFYLVPLFESREGERIVCTLEGSIYYRHYAAGIYYVAECLLAKPVPQTNAFTQCVVTPAKIRLCLIYEFYSVFACLLLA